MAVRRESVVLELDDRFSSKMARAAATAALLKNELNGLDGKRVSHDLEDASKGIDKVSSSSRRADSDINKLTGRLRLFADAAVVLGPAGVPLGAAAVGGLVAMSAQLGATLGALGVTLLAVNGLGDGLKALDAYQLEPTTENLAKLRQEMDKLGPSGEHFVRFLDGLEPELKSLQMAARDGLLPGAEEGITALLDRLPELRSLIRGFADELGDLSAGAGSALGGKRFDAFFEYLRVDGIPILDDTAKTAGNLAETVANLFVAFGGLSTDISGGLLRFSQGLAEASANLGSSAGFQEFLSYIETEGPHALETLGSLGNALLQIVEATAPLGGPVLTAVTAFADAIAAIADSDLGAPVFAGLAALALYTRGMKLLEATSKTAFGQIVTGEKQVELGFGKAGMAARTFGADLLAVGRYGSLATESSTRLQTQAGKLGRAAGPVAALALATSGLADSTGLSNTAMLAAAGSIVPGWGTAIGAAAGYALDFRAANGKAAESINEFNLALAASRGDLLASQNAIDAYRTQIAAMQDDLDTDSFGEFFKNAFDPDVAVAFTRESFGMKTGADQAADAADAAQSHLDNLAAAQKRIASGATATVGPLTFLSTAIEANASAAEEEANALIRSVDAMRAKRAEALRALDAELNYQAAIDDANQALKENGRNFDVTTEKGRANRQALYALADGWNQQSDAAKNAQGSLRTARQGFIQTATAMGASAGQAKNLADRLFEIPPKRRTQIGLDGVETAIGQAQTLSAALSLIVSKTITITVKRAGDALGAFHFADGGYTGPGPRLEPRGVVHAGEVVIPQTYVKRDWSMLKARYGDLPGFDRGGLVANTYVRSQGLDRPPNRHGDRMDDTIQIFVAGAWSAAKALKAMKDELGKDEKALDKHKSALEQLTSQRDSLAGSATSSLLHDPFGNGLAGFDTQTAADAADSTAMLAALQTLVKNGLDPKGALFQALAASGDVNTAQQMAALTSSQLFAEQSSFNQTHALAGQVGQFAGSEAFGQAIKDQSDAIKEFRQEVRHLRQELNEFADKAGDNVKQGAAEGVEHSVRAGNGHRDGEVASLVRTQPRPQVKRGKK